MYFHCERLGWLEFSLRSISFLNLCICVCYELVCRNPKGSEDDIRSPWNWKSRWVRAAMWVLGTEPESSVRALSILNCWATSLGLLFWFFWDRISSSLGKLCILDPPLSKNVEITGVSPLHPGIYICVSIEYGHIFKAMLFSGHDYCSPSKAEALLDQLLIRWLPLVRESHFVLCSLLVLLNTQCYPVL